MKMKLGEQPRKLVHSMVTDVERIDRPVVIKNVGIVILSELNDQYDIEARIPERSSNWSTRKWIKCFIDQFDRLKLEKPDTGSKSLIGARGASRNSNPSIPPASPSLLANRSRRVSMPQIEDRHIQPKD